MVSQPPGDERSVDVVIPTWNQRSLVAGCLESLRSSAVATRVFLVDNASDDDTVDYVAAHFPEVEIVLAPENLGYGRAVNLGVRAGASDIVFFMNNDVNVGADFIKKVVAAFDDETIGMAGGITLNPADGTIDVAGVSIDRGLGLYARWTGEDPASVKTDDPSVMGPGGAVLAFKRSALDEVGLFDEEFFAYSEDVDLFLRLKVAGWNFALVEDARAPHLGSASFGARSIRQQNFAAWSRGYLAGRYRIGPLWLLTEVAVGLVDSLHFRSPVPITRRVSGWRRGRALPRKVAPDGLPYLGWVDAMKLRFKAM